MPHLTSPSEADSTAVPSGEVDSTDPLATSLRDLSLGTQQPHPTGDNAPLAYSEGNSREQPLVDDVEHLVRNVIRPYLDSLRQDHRFELNEMLDLYAKARQLQRKWNVPETSFINFCELLSGLLEFPSILLLNPSPVDGLPLDEMVERSPTLSWLRETLESMHLTIRDVIILDTFPMATDALMDRLNNEDRRQFARETFELTVQCLRHIRPQVLISCKCATQPLNDRWGFVDHVMARNLCSSVDGARNQRVRTVHIDNTHAMRVVEGFHPNFAIKMMRVGPGSEFKGMLLRLFESIFQPFGDWKSMRDAVLQELHDSLALVRAGLLAQLRQVKLYRQMHQRALDSGIVGPLALERVEELELRLDQWTSDI